jgi:hypothetical protein
MVYDWDNFVVFEGSCALSKNIFRATNYQSNRDYFFRCLNRLSYLRNEPGHHGIPDDKVDAVENLLNAFFDNIQPNNSPKYELLFIRM